MGKQTWVKVPVLLTTRAAGGGAEWSTDIFSDFCDGTMDGVDVWSELRKALKGPPATGRGSHQRRWLPFSLNVKLSD